MVEEIITSKAIHALDNEVDSLENELEVFKHFNRRINRLDDVRDLKEMYQEVVIGNIGNVPQSDIEKLTNSRHFDSEEFAHMYYVLSYEGASDCGVIRFLSKNQETELRKPFENQLRQRINQYTRDLTAPINFLDKERACLEDYREILKDKAEKIEETQAIQNNINSLAENDAIELYHEQFKPIEEDLEDLLSQRQSELNSYPSRRRKWLEDVHTEFKTTYPVLFDASNILDSFYSVENEYSITHIA